jgi:PAS domain S-box-containing protein
MESVEIESGTGIDKRGYEHLKRNEARLRALLQNSSDIISLLDCDGKILYVTPSVQSILGYTPEELVGTNALSLIHACDYERMQAALMHIVVEGRGETHSYRIRCADGSWKWLETTGINLMSNPDVGAIVIDSRDVTALKKAQHAVEEIMDSTMDAVFSVDREWRFTYLNAQAEAAFNAPAHQLLGRNIWKVVPEAVDTDFYRHYHRVMDTQEAVAFEAHVPLRDAWFEARAYPTRSGLSVYFRDITERMRTKQALQESEFRLQSVLSSAALIMWAIDANGIFTLSTGQMLQRIGLRPGEVVGRSIFEVYADQPAILEDARRVLAGEEFASEHEVGDIVLETRYTTVRDASGAVTGAIGVATDITERKRAEKLVLENAGANALRADIANALMRTNNLNEMLQNCAQALFNHLDAALSRVWITQDDQATLELKASVGITSFDADTLKVIPVGHYKVGRIAAERSPHLTNDLLNDLHLLSPEWARQEGIVAFAGQPLIVNDQVIGVLAIFARHPLSKQTLKLLESISTKIALGIERQRALVKVRESEERYRSLVRASSQIVWSADAHGHILDMPDWRAFTGQTPEQVRGLGWLDAIHPDDRSMVLETIQFALEKQTLFRTEYRIRKYDGTYEYFLARGVPLLDPSGEVREWVGMSTNIQERKQAEQNLQKVLSNVQCILWRGIVERRNGELLWNLRIVNEEAAQRVLNMDVKSGDSSLFHSCLTEDAERVDRRASQAILSGEIGYSHEFRCLARDGNVKWLHEDAHIEPLAPGKWLVVGVCTDITERKRVEGELAASHARLERSNRELTEFAYVASHDLQEPLRKIQMFADLIQSQHSDTLHPEAANYMQRMQSAARRMQTLIQSTLSLSHVSTNTSDFQMVDLKEVVQDVLGDLVVRVQSTGARVDVEELCAVEADPSQMRQLFQNLLGNALKFHRPDVPPHIQIRSHILEDRDACCITVSDNGIGFNQEFAERIFLPFRRLRGHSQYEGSGMGLAICRRITERHGGSISVQSTLGEGATFCVVLPLRQEMKAEDKAT